MAGNGEPDTRSDCTSCKEKIGFSTCNSEQSDNSKANAIDSKGKDKVQVAHASTAAVDESQATCGAFAMTIQLFKVANCNVP